MVSTLSRNRVREDMPVSFASDRSSRAYPVAFSETLLNGSAIRQPSQAPLTRPHLVPVEAPARKARKAPILVRANRALQASLIALCGVAILGYGYDVASTHDVSKQQDQVRRISEQNAEYSSKLLQTVSYQDVQNRVTGHTALRVPEEVKIVTEVPAPKLKPFKAAKYHLPLMSGY